MTPDTWNCNSSKVEPNCCILGVIRSTVVSFVHKKRLSLKFSAADFFWKLYRSIVQCTKSFSLIYTIWRTVRYFLHCETRKNTIWLSNYWTFTLSRWINWECGKSAESNLELNAKRLTSKWCRPWKKNGKWRELCEKKENEKKTNETAT